MIPVFHFEMPVFALVPFTLDFAVRPGRTGERVALDISLVVIKDFEAEGVRGYFGELVSEKEIFGDTEATFDFGIRPTEAARFHLQVAGFQQVLLVKDGSVIHTPASPRSPRYASASAVNAAHKRQLRFMVHSFHCGRPPCRTCWRYPRAPVGVQAPR